MRCALGLLLALWVVPSQAQVSVGLRAGVNVSTLTPQPFLVGTERISGAASVFADIPVRGRFSVRPEVLLSSEGVRYRPYTQTTTLEDGTVYEYADEGGALQGEYVGAGAFAAYTVPVGGVSIQPYVGPAARVKVRERQVDHFEGTTSERSSDVLDLTAVSAVGGVTAGRGRVGLDLRYALSFNDVINRDLIVGGGTIRSSVATAALVYRLP